MLTLFSLQLSHVLLSLSFLIKIFLCIIVHSQDWFVIMNNIHEIISYLAILEELFQYTLQAFLCLMLHCFLYLFMYLLYRYWQLRVERNQAILNSARRENILATKSQTENILGASRIWKHWEISIATRCNKIIVFFKFLIFNEIQVFFWTDS